MNPKLLSFVAPVFNEEANLAELIDRCLRVGNAQQADFEIILVDDGSSDRSAEIIADQAALNPTRVLGVFLNRNYGQHAAVLAGLEASRGDVVVTLDADLQNPPEEIPKLIEAIKRGCDVVGGVRRRRQDSRFRRLASRLMNSVMRKLCGLEISDYGCMLRAYRRDIVDAMLKCEEHSAYVPALANAFAGNPCEVTVEHAQRGGGESKYRLWSLVNLYFDLLISSSTAPLRLLSIAGGVLAILGIGFGTLLLLLRFTYGPDWAAQGVFTVLAILFVFLGVQLLGMGLLGEYIGRISRDVQRRPRYLLLRQQESRPAASAPTFAELQTQHAQRQHERA